MGRVWQGPASGARDPEDAAAAAAPWTVGDGLADLSGAGPAVGQQAFPFPASDLILLPRAEADPLWAAALGSSRAAVVTCGWKRASAVVNRQPMYACVDELTQRRTVVLDRPRIPSQQAADRPLIEQREHLRRTADQDVPRDRPYRDEIPNHAGDSQQRGGGFRERIKSIRNAVSPEQPPSAGTPPLGASGARGARPSGAANDPRESAESTPVIARRRNPESPLTRQRRLATQQESADDGPDPSHPSP
jgi:hypothetical protein